MDVTSKRTILRIDEAGSRILEDVLLNEVSYRFLVNGQTVMVFHCIPEHLEQLALGNAFCQGLFTDLQEIKDLQVDDTAKEIRLTTGAADPSRKIPHGLDLARKSPQEQDLSRTHKDSLEEPTFTSDRIHSLYTEFSGYCDLFRLTGASHSCALADQKGILLHMNDVARHNALDKVIGEMLLRQIDPSRKALVFSGRLALDMIVKAAKSGVKVLIAPGAPTLTAVELAEKSDLTLLGFVRPDNINIYTHWHRVRQAGQ